VSRNSLSQLAPRTNNDNPFRKRWDILLSQRKELLETLKTILLVRANNLNDDNLESFKEVMEDYLNTSFPENAKDTIRKDKDLLAGWENVFKAGKISITAIDEKKDFEEAKRMEKQFNIKNLSQS